MAVRVGFIGLGNIGLPMAENVAAAGFQIMVTDVRDEPCQHLAAKGAKVARSLRELAEFSDLIEIVVVNDEQVEQVTLGPEGVLAAAKRGAVIAIHSTVSLAAVRRIAAAAEPRGVKIIDAMVSGGARGATNRTLCYMVGGEKAAFELARTVFSTSSQTGDRVIHLGPLGAGTIAKIAHNMMLHINTLSAAEGIRLAHKAGVNMEAFKSVIQGGSAQSRMAEHWGWRHELWTLDLPGGPSPTPRHGYKDLQLALDLGHELGVPLPGAALAQQLRDDIA